MPEGWSQYLVKLFPEILTQTCSLSISYTLVKVSTYRNKVKRMVGWDSLPHCYIFPLLQCSISLSVTRLFHLAKCSRGCHIAEFPSFLRLNKILLYVYTTFSLEICLLQICLLQKA